MPLFTQAARLFEIVASSGSIRKASERINLAPSAINRQILNLEAELGTPVFTRHARGMNLTEAGRMLVDNIRIWQAQEEELRSRIEQIKGRSGHVRLGVMECFAQGFTAKAYASLIEQCGKVAFDVSVGSTRELADWLLAGELDLAIAFNMPGDQGFRVLHEMRLDIGVTIRASETFDGVGSLDGARLQGLPIVLADHSLTIEPIVRTLMESLGLTSQTIARSNSVNVIKKLVAQGAGVSFLTWADVRDEVLQGELAFLPVGDRRMFELLSVCGRDPALMSASSRALVNIVIRELNAMGKEPQQLFADAAELRDRAGGRPPCAGE